MSLENHISLRQTRVARHSLLLSSLPRLHPNNVLGIKSFADQFMCRSLEDACDKYIQIHFMEVSKSEEFLSLDEDRVTAILARDQLHITGEEQVCFTHCVHHIVLIKAMAIGRLLIYYLILLCRFSRRPSTG